MATSLKILLVEDFEPFRQLLRAELEQRPEFRIVGEFGDGFEAVRNAVELQPDLVLIDIRLSASNGLDVATRIRGAVSHAKLLFVSLESSHIMVRETFRIGGHGYVDKLHARHDLMSAIDALMQGAKFVSSSLNYRESMQADSRHDIHFSSDDEKFLESMTGFVAAALNAGNPAIVLASAAHRRQMIERLKQITDVESAIRSGAYIEADAEDVLQRIMVDGLPDHSRFLRALDDGMRQALRAARTPQPRIAIFGECSSLLCNAGNFEAAVQLERTGHELVRTHNIDLLCGYSLCDHCTDERAFKKICAEHTSFCCR